MLLILFDLMMALIMFLIGLFFYKSKGKAVNLLTGYNMKADDERQKYNEPEMCINYGIRLMIMAIPFLIGAILDYFSSGMGCMFAWIILTILLILLVKKRIKIEK
ncbi:MAG: DUF3784 domain-containing protein [Hespellia sp.]|nr:DUF3784 domain-containing protein [Hespellia sp.]